MGNVAPMMGFEVERAEILSNNMPEEPQLDTQRSNISTDMRDEIKNMIDARVKEQLNNFLGSIFDMQKMHCNTKDAQPKTEEKPKAEEKKQEEAPKPKKAHKLAHIRTPQQTNNLPKEDPRLEGVVDKVLAILPHLPRDVVKEFVAEKDLIETDENSRLEAVIKQFM